LKRKLWLLNFVLIAAIAAGVWRVRKDAREFDARKQATLAAKVPAAPAPPAPAAVPPPAVAASSYLEIAQKMLWSKDRNSQVVVEEKPVEVKPLPPLPSVHGVINMGDGPIVMMSDKQGERQRGIHPGEMIGAFKLISVNSEELVLGFEDRTVKKRLQELIVHKEDPAPSSGGGQGGVANTGGVPPPPPSTVVGRPEPGVVLSEGVNNCQPGDNSPAGTVANGMRKVVMATPFGMACKWEAVK
jgi:hypothetical protein